MRKRRARCRAVGTRAPILVDAKANARWSLDFVHDQFACGRRFRVLNIVDDVTRECLAAVPDTSISGRRVARELTDLIRRRGKPGMIVADHGTGFTSNAILAGAKDAGVDQRIRNGGDSSRYRMKLPAQVSPMDIWLVQPTSTPIEIAREIMPGMRVVEWNLGSGSSPQTRIEQASKAIACFLRELPPETTEVSIRPIKRSLGLGILGNTSFQTARDRACARTGWIARGRSLASPT